MPSNNIDYRILLNLLGELGVGEVFCDVPHSSIVSTLLFKVESNRSLGKMGSVSPVCYDPNSIFFLRPFKRCCWILFCRPRGFENLVVWSFKVFWIPRFSIFSAWLSTGQNWHNLEVFLALKLLFKKYCRWQTLSGGLLHKSVLFTNWAFSGSRDLAHSDPGIGNIPYGLMQYAPHGAAFEKYSEAWLVHNAMAWAVMSTSHWVHHTWCTSHYTTALWATLDLSRFPGSIQDVDYHI